MKQFRKKPVIIEAIQWTNSPGNFTDILEWSDHKVTSASPLIWEQTEKEPIGPFCLEIKTLEGVMLARLNDWIIKEPFPTGDREFYPCKPDIFEKTYEPLINDKPLTGIELIAQERKEQIEKHGFDVKNDGYYESGELVDAALFAITGDDKYYPNDWGDWWRNKMVAKTNSTPHSKIERLKIAGALIAAEIDRLQSIKNENQKAS